MRESVSVIAASHACIREMTYVCEFANNVLLIRPNAYITCFWKLWIQG